jgi:hypothetical protein
LGPPKFRGAILGRREVIERKGNATASQSKVTNESYYPKGRKERKYEERRDEKNNYYLLLGRCFRSNGAGVRRLVDAGG